MSTAHVNLHRLFFYLAQTFNSYMKRSKRVRDLLSLYKILYLVSILSRRPPLRHLSGAVLSALDEEPDISLRILKSVPSRTSRKTARTRENPARQLCPIASEANCCQTHGTIPLSKHQIHPL